MPKLGGRGRGIACGFYFWVLARVWIRDSDCWFWVWDSRIQSGFGFWDLAGVFDRGFGNADSSPRD